MTDVKQYSELSKKLTKDISRIDKKKDGIFFTPPSIIQKNYEYLSNYSSNFKKILEPSCGSCEYINYLLEKYDNKNIENINEITGIEYNKTIYNSIKNFNSDSDSDSDSNIVKLINADFLKYEFSIKSLFDLIIGNPPYFIMKSKDLIANYADYEDYKPYFEGRPNIFILFIIKSLKLLKKDTGILSFILPKNFLNCLYYDKLRKHIYTTYTILTIQDCSEDNYIETQQDTILFIVQNKLPSINGDNSNGNNANLNKQFTFTKIKKYTIFNTKENIKKLKHLYKGSKTLNNMNFTVSVGNVVWNQCKDILIDNPNQDDKITRLIYNSDITNNELKPKKYKNDKKKNFIKKDGNTDIILVINRGYGKGDYNFNYCLIDINTPYLIENHLICIKYKNSEDDEDATRDDIKDKYKKIIKSLKNDKTHQFIKLYFANNAINTTELNNVIPIYDL